MGFNNYFTAAFNRRLRAIRSDRTLIARRFLLIGVDAVVLLLSFWAGFALRLNQLFPLQFWRATPLLPPLLFLGIGSLFFSGWYRGLTRSTGSYALYGLIPRTGLIVLLLLLVCTLQGSVEPPRSFWLLLWALSTAGLILSRLIARDLLRFQFQRFFNSQKGLPSLIYGAGEAGQRLLKELHHNPLLHVVALVDDNPALWNRRIDGLKVNDPESLLEVVERQQIRQVLLALPTVARQRRRDISIRLRALGVDVLTIPSLADITSGRQRLTELQPVAIEDLLGREPIAALPNLLEEAVAEKVVLITGAGGSIGSELCRQVLRSGAKLLLMLDRSEYALYSIQQELNNLYHEEKERILPVLTDASNQIQLEILCRRHGVQLFIHAAAYKHVPLVEANVCAALANNLNCTSAALAAATNCGVERFTLISTDKAVRPTNVMGASKRVCEQLVQNAAAAALLAGQQTLFSMVRFGNVLGSSGSVLPLFRSQIAAGGPVTVTHPEITRYFMTIPEAVQLVLQAAAMASGGEVFVLDMGEPVQIADLARQMIMLSGFSVKDEDNLNGDIEVKFSGLRPGEKLYEELLISADDLPTKHPLIRQAHENFLPIDQLEPLLEQLQDAILADKQIRAKDILALIVPEYKPVNAN
jgi:FlaA1/EpsC-like NDP-sugar epimerase